VQRSLLISFLPRRRNLFVTDFIDRRIVQLQWGDRRRLQRHAIAAESGMLLLGRRTTPNIHGITNSPGETVQIGDCWRRADDVRLEP
jgi:hypothetical protein